MRDWIVAEALGTPYAVWMVTYHPSVADRERMRRWLASLEYVGPPTLIDISDDGLPVAEGPNGERVEFVDADG